MKYSANILDFLDLYLLFYFIGAVTSLTLLPTDGTIEKYVNGTHVHQCLGGEGVKWYNNKKQQIPPKGRVHVEDIREGGSRLFFERLETGDEGEYSCKLAGDKDKVSFTLKVIKKISFGSTPKVQKSNEFQDVTLKCDVSGLPKPTVSWHFKGKSIDSSTEGTKYKMVVSGLLIRNVTQKDAGEYQCKAYQTSLTNSDMQEITVTLKVNHKPMWTHLSNNSDRDIFYGYVTGIVNLTCEAIGEPPATFTWMKNNRALKLSHYNATVINETDRSVLQLPIYNDSYYGDYECHAGNKLGNISRTIELKKGEKPDMPSFIEVRKISVHTAEIKVLSSNKEDEIIGFRMQYAVEDSGLIVDWKNSKYQDFNKTDDGIYTLKDLLEYTKYEVKVASRNVAGLSDFSASYELRTERQIDSTSRATVHLVMLSAVVTSLLLVAVH